MSYESRRNLTRSTADIRRFMVARAIAGRSYSEILRWLEAMEAITPKNHRALLATPPRDPDPESRWQLTVVRDMLLSPVMRGHLVKKDGTVVRTADGSPVLQGEPLIDDDTWFKLQDALTLLATGNSGPRRKDGHPLLGILVCRICDTNMYVDWYAESTTKRDPATGKKVKIPTGVKKEVFRCFGKNHEAGVAALSIQAAGVMEFVEEQFLAHMGPFRRTQIVRVPGVDYRAEIADLEADIAELSTRLAQLRGPAADAVMTQLQGRSDRLEELAVTPVVPAREEVVELDTTWADDWRSTVDTRARREMLMEAGVRVTVHPPETVSAFVALGDRLCQTWGQSVRLTPIFINLYHALRSFGKRVLV
ncbi:recombinase family protein [Streptomyces sp. MMS24-I29]|uniref:recombinase family protein n=1 Tax=Streptomyces sp. MMS24-I29 TaxID=3351480 RepID=UPI003C7D0C7A